MRPLLRLFLAFVASLWLTSLAQAQTHSWTGGSDNWNDALNWNVGGVPNDPTHWALIGQSGPLQVTLDINVTLDRLDLTGTDANLFTNGRTLTILSNAGIGTPMGASNSSVLRLASSTFTGGGQLTNWSTVVSVGTSAVENLYNEGLLQVSGDATYGNSTLTLSGNATNFDIIDVTSQGGAYAATLRTTGGTQLNQSGTLNFSTEDGGSRTFNGSMINRGFTNIGQPTTFSGGPIIQDQNRMHVFGGHLLTVSNNVTFQLDGGELTVDGDMLQTSGDFIWNGGDIMNRAPTLASSDLQIDFSNLGIGSLRMVGTGTVDGIWRSGKGLTLSGDGTYGNNTTTWLGTGDLMNQGQISATAVGGAFSVTQIITPGARFVNQGQLTTEVGTGGARFLRGNYLNDLAGALTFNADTTLQNGPYENKGSMSTTAGAAVTFNNNVVFTQTDGIIDVTDGDWFHPSGDAFFNGGNVTGTLRFASTDLTFGPAFGSFLDAEFYGTATKTGDLKSGQELRILGDGAYGNATLTLTQPTVNDGTLIQSSQGGAFSSTLNDGGQGLTNTGTMRFEPGNGGARSLNAVFGNDGTVLVNTGLTLGNGSYVNRGSWTVASGASVSLNNNRSFTQESGTLQIDGSWFHPSGDAFLTGGSVTGVPTFASTDITFGAGFTSPFEGRSIGTSTWTGDLQPMQKLTLEGSSTYGNQTQNTTGSTNLGEIDMTASGGAFSVRLGTTNQVFTNAGTVRSLDGTGGGRFLRGDITNTGLLDLDANTNFEDGPVLHSGTIEVDATAHLSFNNSMTFEMSDGLLQIDGSFEQQSGTARLLGGTVTGTPLFSSMQLELGPSYSTPLTANLRGTSTLTGDVAAGQTLQLRGDGVYGNGTLNLAGATQVDGEIELTALNAAYTTRLGTTNVPLTNEGTIRVSPGTFGPRFLRGDLQNNGLIQVDQSLTFEDGPVIQNGTLNIAAGADVRFNNSMTFEMTGGSMAIGGSFEIPSGTTRMLGGLVTGVPLISSGSLELDPAFTSAYEANLRGTVSLTGEVAADHVLHLRGDGVFGNGTLNIPAPLTNQGTIELLAQNAAYAATINATLGNEIANQGTIRTLPGSGGTRNLNMQLENDGLIEVLSGTTIGRSSANNRNGGAMQIKAGLTLVGSSFTNENGGRVANASTITNTQFTIQNDGTWAIGDTIGTSTITNNWTQGSDGRLVIQIGGLAPGTEHDQMVIGGTANVAGRVRLKAANGYEPKFGDQFVILTASSTDITGFEGITYDGDLPLGYGFELVDTGTSLLAQVVQTIEGVNPGEVPLSLGDPVPGIAGQVNTFQVSGATGSGQIVIVYGLALGSTASGVCSGVDFGIDAAQQVGAGFASTNGNALVSANVPAGAAGMTAYFQALDLERCELSDVTSFVFP